MPEKFDIRRKNPPTGPAQQAGKDGAAKARTALLRLELGIGGEVQPRRLRAGFTRHRRIESYELVRRAGTDLPAGTTLAGRSTSCPSVIARSRLSFSGPTFAVAPGGHAVSGRRWTMAGSHVAAECVENLDRETAVNVLAEMCELVCFQAGDRAHVEGHPARRRAPAAPDGRLVWRPDGGSVN